MFSQTDANYGTWINPGVIDESIPNAFRESHQAIVNTLLDTTAGSMTDQSAPIVEAASGLGGLGEIIDPTFHDRYVQTDRTPLYAAASKTRNPQLATLTADVYRLPFGDESVGTVIAKDLFDILDEPRTAVDEIQRVVATDGHFIHLQDRRPNIEHIIQQVHERAGSQDTDEVVFLPGVSGDTMTHMRVVSREDYETAFDKWPSSIQELVHHYASSPEGWVISRLERPHEVDKVSRIVQRIPGFDTPTFNELFTDYMTTLFQAAGFYVVSGCMQRETIVGQDCIGHLFGQDYLKQYAAANERYPSNVLTMSQNGRSEFALHDTAVPKGMIRQIGMLNVLIAQKK